MEVLFRLTDSKYPTGFLLFSPAGTYGFLDFIGLTSPNADLNLDLSMA